MAEAEPSIEDILGVDPGGFRFFDHDGREITFKEHIAIKPEERRLGADEVGPYFISTVFLGYAWRDFPDQAPLVWETMVWRGDDVLECVRVATRELAEQAHAAAVDEARRGVWDN